MGTQTFVNNTVNDLLYEIKFESCMKDRNNFINKRNITFLSKTKKCFLLGDIVFFKIPKNLITSAFLFFC